MGNMGKLVCSYQTYPPNQEISIAIKKEGFDIPRTEIRIEELSKKEFLYKAEKTPTTSPINKARAIETDASKTVPGNASAIISDTFLRD